MPRTLISSGHQKAMVDVLPITFFYRKFKRVDDFDFATILCTQERTKH
jgi:hypothetical protein